MITGKELWSGFCNQIKKIFPKNMCIYPSEMDIDSLKAIQKDKNIKFSNKNEIEETYGNSKISAVKDILKRNYYFLCKPRYWNVDINSNRQLKFNYTEVNTDFSKFIKQNKLKGILKILEKCSRLRNQISAPNSDLETNKDLKGENDELFILENLDDPRVLAGELNKIQTFLNETNELYSTESPNRKQMLKYLLVAMELYKILKQLEFQATLLKRALGDNKEDNNYIIERKRPASFIWKILSLLGLGRHRYQKISDGNGSSEFTLGELFKRSKIYRRMIRAYIDSNDNQKKISSIKRKLFRIKILLNKWVELYASKPTRNDERLHLLKLIYGQIQGILKFTKVKEKTTLVDLNGDPITAISFILNIDGIRQFLLNWRELYLTNRVFHSIKNLNPLDLIKAGLQILDRLP